jgi:hypothetical protein
MSVASATAIGPASVAALRGGGARSPMMRMRHDSLGRSNAHEVRHGA